MMNNIQTRNEMLRHLQTTCSIEADLATEKWKTAESSDERTALVARVTAYTEVVQIIGAMMLPERDMTTHDLMPDEREGVDI